MTQKRVFIVSSGRTGTEFFGINVGKISDDVFSIHEPDALSISKKKRIEFYSKVKLLGWLNLLIKKPLGLYGTRALSLQRLGNKISGQKAINKFLEERKWIDQNYKFFVESNHNLFGLTKELSELDNTKLFILVRDPRDWITSMMNKGGWYDRKDMSYRLNILGFKRLTPNNVHEYHQQWNEYSKFEKLCWSWNYINNHLFRTAEKQNDNVRLFYFEDIFLNKERSKIEKMLQFIFGKDYNTIHLDKCVELMKSKINARPKDEFDDWKKWDSKTCQTLDAICGELMRKFGYGSEVEWKEKLKKEELEAI